MSLFHLAVIGAGQVGSRHLQALAAIEVPVTITVIDPSPRSLELARSRLAEMPPNPQLGEVRFATRLEEVGKRLDLAIVATTADVRLPVLERLLTACRVRYLVLEKVVFQSDRAFVEAGRLFREHRVAGVWVNCFRRSVDLYDQIRAALPAGDPLRLRVEGVNWGLACNAIHFLDLATFFCGETRYVIDTGGLGRTVLSSRRSGFSEVTGSLRAVFQDGCSLLLKEDIVPDRPLAFTIEVETGDAHLKVYELEGWLQATGDLWPWQGKATFARPYQSRLTQAVARDILTDGRTRLTPFEEAHRLHRPLLAALTEFMASLTGTTLQVCPIT